jgi:hypothetical protein
LRNIYLGLIVGLLALPAWADPEIRIDGQCFRQISIPDPLNWYCIDRSGGGIYHSKPFAEIVAICAGVVNGLLRTGGAVFVPEPCATPTVTLTWTNPIVNTDGSPLVDLTSVRIYDADTLELLATEPATAPGNSQSFVFSTASICFYIAAVNGVDRESDPSSVGCRG